MSTIDVSALKSALLKPKIAVITAEILAPPFIYAA